MTTLGQITPGSIVTLNENGKPVQFYVGTQDYESGLNGTGRTLLVRKDCCDDIQWSSKNHNNYASSNIDDWFENTYKNTLDLTIRILISNIRIWYYYLYRQTMEASIFSLSMTELGEHSSGNTSIPSDIGNELPIADTLKIAYRSGAVVDQWTRDPFIGSDTDVWYMDKGDYPYRSSAANYKGPRPCLTLPSTLTVDDNNAVVAPSITLGNAPVGSIIKINENGQPQNYIVVNQGIPGNSPLYDQSCDGTWVLRKDIYENRQWSNSISNSYKASTIHTYLNGTFLNLFDADIREVIKQVKIPYVNGTGNSAVASGSSGLSCKIFLLSGYEVGFTTSVNQYFPNDGAKLDYFISGNSNSAQQKRIAKLNGSAAYWWLRSPNTDNTSSVWYVNYNGGYLYNDCSLSYGIRPALVLPTNLTVLPDGTLQDTPTFNTLPIQVMEGQSLPITWSAMDGATSYTLQRQVDSGGFTTIYTGADTSYTDTVPAGSTLQYQVSATIGSTAGAYGQSDVISIISASILTISGTDSDLGILTNDITYAVSTDTGNPISLTRTVNNIQVAELTVDSGFAYTIPVIDLPTGSGTIVITATVSTTSGPVTATRTWTYTKMTTTFSNSGGVAQLVQNGQNVFPITIAEAVRVPTNWGGSLDKALELVYPAVQSAVISVGTYTGTGTYGQDNPNTLTFTDTPSVVTIYGNGMTLAISSTDTSSAAYISGNTATWYSTVSAETQMNADGVVYNYVAIASQA